MGWFAIDDQFPFNTKVMCAGNAAVGAWVRMGAWSAQQLTDGFVPAAVARQIATDTELACLLAVPPGAERGLLVEQDGGFLLPDFLDYNPSKATTVKKRQANAERMRRTRQGVRENVQENVHAHNTRTNGVTASEVRASPTPNPISNSSTHSSPPLTAPATGGDVDNFVNEVVSRTARLLLEQEPAGAVRSEGGWLTMKRRQLIHHHAQTICSLGAAGKTVDDVVEHLLGMSVKPRVDDLASARRFGAASRENEHPDDHDPVAFREQLIDAGHHPDWVNTALEAYAASPDCLPVAAVADANGLGVLPVRGNATSEMRGA